MSYRMGVPSKSFDALKFTCYNAEEIRNISVMEVTNPRSLDFLLNPTEKGLYDPVLGPPTRLDSCKTCGQGSIQCPGHLSHIELPLPVYHPVFFNSMHYLLRGSCLRCHIVLLNRSQLLLLYYKLEALKNGLYQLTNDLEEKYRMVVQEEDESTIETSGLEILQEALGKLYNTALSEREGPGEEANYFSKNAMELRRGIVKEFLRITSAKTKCQKCGNPPIYTRVEQNCKIFFGESRNKKSEATQHYVTPVEAREHLSKLWANDGFILRAIFGALHDVALEDAVHEASEESKKSISSPMDVFFLTVVAVPPPKYRPVMSVNGKQYENPQSSLYSKIIVDCMMLRTLTSVSDDEDVNLKEVDATQDLVGGKTQMFSKSDNIKISDKSWDMLAAIPGKTKADKLENCWERLQKHVNLIFDSESFAKGGEDVSEKCPGIKQKLEKKNGLFRKNMMGKRVNFAARSVISPDPYIATNEIGVPLCFASKLTYPTPVTSWNVKKLRQNVINGPKIYPGATMVRKEDGSSILLKADDPIQREAIANQLIAPEGDGKTRKDGLRDVKIVLRHMEDGDVVLVNRQPTLHKGSIMAHKVRVLPGEKTLRLHYANCKSYNADFDGDEMNAHFPQDELCRSEAYNLMSTNSQYLSGKDGKPLSGLIQDHMVAGVHMSVRGRCFNREQYLQLCTNAMMGIRKKLILLPPTILKPEKLWTGKQVFSTLLMNIIPTGAPLLNLTTLSKIRFSDWENTDARPANIRKSEMCESQVIIRNSLLLCGVLDKNQYGANAYGLVHSMHELYGCQYSGELLTCLARLFTAFLQQYRGFTLGVEDILVTAEADNGRTDVVTDSLEMGPAQVAEAFGITNKEDTQDASSKMHDAHLSKVLGKGDGLAAVDHSMKSASNEVTDRIARHCTGRGLQKVFPNNNLQLMVTSGAKGGKVNCMQISCLLGQIELEGRRPPLMVSGRSMPSFLPYDLTLRAGGFISQRFLTGIRPQEYFHHCMAGREGLVDTAVKTSRSGYLQRCLIKHLEGLVLAYDSTVRDSDGSVMQFLYGEDGIEVSKEAYLDLKQHHFLVNNIEAETGQLPSMETIESSSMDTKTAEKMWKTYRKIAKRKKKADKSVKKQRGIVSRRTSPFADFSWEHATLTKSQAIAAWRNLPADERRVYRDSVNLRRLPDPISSVLPPGRYLGAMTERFRDELHSYLKTNPDRLPKKEKRKNRLPSLSRVKAFLSLKYQKALCNPGESVGVLAAQSIGEPSTQMTLNTFHFAGRGDMNVTLGIPRLREILMTASKQIKTPQVFVPVVPGREKAAEKLRKMLSSVKLHQVLHKIQVEEHLDVDTDQSCRQRTRRSQIRIELLPEKQFGKELALARAFALNCIERRFIRNLVTSLSQQLRLRTEEDMVYTQQMNSAESATNNDQDDEELETTEPTEEPPSQEQLEADEAFDEDDAKRGKNSQDFEEEEEDEMQDNDNEADMPMPVTETMESKEDNNSQAPEKTIDMEDVQKRIANVLNIGTALVRVLKYNFDYEDNGWCTIDIEMPLTTAQLNIVSVVENEAKSMYVRKVRGITRCVLQRNQRDPDDIKFATEGINFYKLFEYPHILDLKRLQCNCVHSVQGTYGIEAASRVISREVANVFAVYGIQVNPRHLTLVADYMCFSGSYKGFNRIGMADCASPLQQMTYESTMSFLKEAALYGQWDSLSSPSARIVAGQLVKAGSGCFAVEFPLSC